MPPRPTLAVFDLDGTLIDSLPDLAEAGRALLGAHGLPRPSDDEIRRMIGDGVRRLVERLIAFAVSGVDGREASANIPDIEAATAEFLTLYTPRATRLTRPYPGALETLAELRSLGIASAVCTNKPEAAARRILDDLGFSADLAAIGGGDTFAWRKPDARHLLGTIERAGHAPERAVMIGDHQNDFLAAEGAGVPFIFAGWGYGTLASPGPSALEVADIREVPALVAQMGSGA